MATGSHAGATGDGLKRCFAQTRNSETIGEVRSREPPCMQRERHHRFRQPFTPTRVGSPPAFLRRPRLMSQVTRQTPHASTCAGRQGVRAISAWR